MIHTRVSLLRCTPEGEMIALFTFLSPKRTKEDTLHGQEQPLFCTMSPMMKIPLIGKVVARLVLYRLPHLSVYVLSHYDLQDDPAVISPFHKQGK